MTTMQSGVMIGLAVLLTASCAANESPSGTPSGEPEQLQEIDGMTADQGDLGKQAIQTLAEFLAVDPGEIKVHSLSPMEWPDSSLGCPKPGMSYLQVITPGHRAVLQHKSSVYLVHMARGKAFVCVKNTVPAAGKISRPE